MIGTKLKIKEDNFKELLKTVLSIVDIKRTTSSILRDLHLYFSTGNDIITNVCNILNSWTIDSMFIPFSFEMFDEIPLTSLIFLYDNQLEKESGTFFVLLEKGEYFVTLCDASQEKLYIEYDELKQRWCDIVIALDTENSKDEEDYERKQLIENEKKQSLLGVSVIMPIYNQAAFVARALRSLMLQSCKDWELILINDGSSDNLAETLLPFLTDKRIRYYENDKNEGLGYTLNKGLQLASHDLIAYLPADDIYFKDHLQSLAETLVLTSSKFAYSGVLHHFNDQTEVNYGQRSAGIIEGYPIQLVQAMHKKTEKRWIERKELVTDDLNRMFWNNFIKFPHHVVGTRNVSCEWVDHALQRHKIINDTTGGGIYLYKRAYGVSEPIRFQSTVGNYIDEIKHFERFRKSGVKQEKKGGLKILLVGELAFNPERICALEERGHQLYGLWMPNPVNFNTIGPLPFGQVKDIPRDNWQEKIDDIKPDIIYALLNYHAIPLAHHVLMNNKDIPFVWHFKEGPFYCRNFGRWNQLIDLYSKSDGQIYTNQMTLEWYQQFLIHPSEHVFLLDGDLPKKEWFEGTRTPLLSERDGQIHTVVAGRPMGIHPEHFRQMAQQNIHIHLYGDVFQSQFKDIIQAALKAAPKHIHLHKNCTQEDWVREFSQYDAGWLHCFKSQNEGELLRASWHDLNFPARMATYAMAGLPMLMQDNKGHRVASQEHLEKEGMALLFSSFDKLRATFDDKKRLETIRHNVWQRRHIFSFDHHVDQLVDFFKEVIRKKQKYSLVENEGNTLEK